ncbi:hypothetical protein Vadar_002840 [Vaccinium darrowii]|uniref:Uncharacterized protein n=1 Tax=Vaccinium darrowii TaxID=229202 RepID=A0ACB7X7J3_9ERIC|nr:hypothetical protein Vadar_002840 [Vaccinium darrowii]
MEEEFLESDFILSQNLVIVQDEVVSDQGHLNSWNSWRTKNPSIPINIPKPILKPVAGNSIFIQSMETNFFDHDGELVPPHVILARRIFDRKMAPSVLTGKGRTLKGRDSCQFRNSVLKMTGFLDGNVSPPQSLRK